MDTSEDLGEKLNVDAVVDDVQDTLIQPVQIEAGWQRRHEDALMRGEEAWIRARGLEAHFRHKSLWSSVLIFTIAWMVIFESILVWCVGVGWWDFTQYSWLIPTLMIQFLAQIVGLGLLVVKSLFRDMD